jgi:hypothetical protein
MAREFERIRLVARGDERQRAVAFERTGEVAQLAVDARGRAALARPGPIAAATSAGVEPAGISRTEPSGRVILNISVMRILVGCPEGAMAHAAAQRKGRSGEVVRL